MKMGLNKEEKFPNVFIQCDWDNTLRTPGNEVWTSYKFKDSPSVHGKISCISENEGSVKYASSAGFSISLLDQYTLEILLPQLEHRAILLAPTIVHSDIHSKSITSFDVTSGGLIVSTGSDDRLLVWDPNGGEQKLALEGHIGEVYRCQFFPSEKVVLSCGSDMSLRIWCSVTGQCPVKFVGHTQPVTDCEIIGRGRNILSVSKDGSVKIWNCATAECIGDIIKVPSAINCCKIHEAPSTTDLGASQHTPSIKEVGTERKLLLLGCEDGMIYCVGLQTRNLLFTLTCGSPINCITFTASSFFVVGCQNGKVIGYKIVDGKAEVGGSWHDSNSSVMCLLPIVGSKLNFFVARADGSVTLRVMTDSSISLHLTGTNCDPVYHITSTSDHVYTSCRDGSIRVYNIKSALNKLLHVDN